MGDGLVKRYAVILNGDTEPRHQDNVEHAIRALRREGSYDISVASTKLPKERVDGYVEADAGKLHDLISGLKKRMDDDDQLVVYVTGHGRSEGEGCVGLPKTCLPFQALQEEIDELPYGKRIVVMDNCFSGNGLRLFANSSTSVVTQGSPGETVSCQTFSPYFWSDSIPDSDGDKKISLQERYDFALNEGKTDSLTQFFSPQPIGFSGEIALRPFATPNGAPIVVNNGAQLDEQLKKLKPGQLALVDFGADWCVPCEAFRPTFEKISREIDGRFLMIRAQGLAGSEDDWERYGIRRFPTVAFIDANGKVTPVSDNADPLDSMLLATTHSPSEQINLLVHRLESSDPAERLRGLKGLEALGKKSTPALAAVTKLLLDPSEANRCQACMVLAKMGPDAAPAVPALIAVLEKDVPPARLGAVSALSSIGPAAKEAIPALLQAVDTAATQRLAEEWERRNGFSAELALHHSKDWAFEIGRNAALALSRIDPKNSQLEKKLLSMARDTNLSSETRIAAILGVQAFEPDSAALGAELANLWQSIKALEDSLQSIQKDQAPKAADPEKLATKNNLAGLGGSFLAREDGVGGGGDLQIGRKIFSGPELRFRIGAYGVAGFEPDSKSDLELRASVSGAWAFGAEDWAVRPAILFPELGVSHRLEAGETAFHGSPLGAELQFSIEPSWRLDIGTRATLDYAEEAQWGSESSLRIQRRF